MKLNWIKSLFVLFIIASFGMATIAMAVPKVTPSAKRGCEEAYTQYFKAQEVRTGLSAFGADRNVTRSLIELGFAGSLGLGTFGASSALFPGNQVSYLLSIGVFVVAMERLHSNDKNNSGNGNEFLLGAWERSEMEVGARRAAYIYLTHARHFQKLRWTHEMQLREKYGAVVHNVSESIAEGMFLADAKKKAQEDYYEFYKRVEQNPGLADVHELTRLINRGNDLRVFCQNPKKPFTFDEIITWASQQMKRNEPLNRLVSVYDQKYYKANAKKLIKAEDAGFYSRLLNENPYTGDTAE